MSISEPADSLKKDKEGERERETDGISGQLGEREHVIESDWTEN